MTGSPPNQHRGLNEQTVVVIGASPGIGLATARLVRALGGQVVMVARSRQRLERAAAEIRPLSTAALDATDTDSLQQFFHDLPGTVDHVISTAGSPSYLPLADLDLAEARHHFGYRIAMTLGIAKYSGGKVRDAGTLLFIGGTGSRRPGVGRSITSALTAALPALTANLALELAPVRVNLIAAGFVDTPLSASLLGDQLEARREELRATLPIRRVVGLDDVARAGRTDHVQRRADGRHLRHRRRSTAAAPLIEATHQHVSPGEQEGSIVDMALEVVVIPVVDVDRSLGFYKALGWRLDADFATGDGLRVVQLTPPGSACSVIFGDEVSSAAPGSAEGLHLVVTDIEAARAELSGNGVDVSEVFHDAGGVFHHAGTKNRVPGPDPERHSYGSYVSFSDPDGNGWTVQEVTERLPGR